MKGPAAGHVQLTVRQLRVLRALRDGPKTAAKIHDVTGYDTPGIHHALTVWRERGVVEREVVSMGRGRSKFCYLWSIADASLTFKHPSYNATVTITFPKG